MSAFPAAALIEVAFDDRRGSGWRLGAPPLALQTKRYALGLAQTTAELDEVLRLRFAVFNLELGEGLATSCLTGRDEDEFDRQCHHLIVTERRSGRIVGTYRLQTNEMAARGSGFYSAGEFDLTQLPERILDNAIELGRACIDQAHRHTEVLLLLWRGIAAYLQWASKRYLFGCCSLGSQAPRDAWAVKQQLAQGGHLAQALAVPPQPGFACELPEAVATGVEPMPIPKLFRSYLRFGAKVCSPPALDRQFRTIDFLLLLDVAALDERAQQLLCAA